MASTGAETAGETGFGGCCCSGTTIQIVTAAAPAANGANHQRKVLRVLRVPWVRGVLGAPRTNAPSIAWQCAQLETWASTIDICAASSPSSCQAASVSASTHPPSLKLRWAKKLVYASAEALAGGRKVTGSGETPAKAGVFDST